MSNGNSIDRNLHENDRFATTQWSMVAKAGDRQNSQSQDALQSLSQRYWFPLYAYARRRVSHEQAKDLTQEFFCVLLEKNFLKTADREKGRFRAFLLTAFKRFMLNDHDRSKAIKRGGNVLKLSIDFESADSQFAMLPVDNATPEKIFERQWVLTLLENVMTRLKEYYCERGEEYVPRFEALNSTIVGSGSEDYLQLSQQLGMTPESLRVQVHRMRKKYQEILRSEIASTVASVDEIDDEIQRLFELMG